jgi:large repetitive protein
MTQSELLCYGDTNASASIAVQGGSPPYSYSWSNGGNAAGLTNLGAGTYCVTATDSKGCIVDTCIKFTEPAAIMLYSSGDQTICLSQEANLVAAAVGGIQPYSYFWTPGGYITSSITVEPAESTEFCVYAKDFHGCKSNVRCASIFVNPPLEMIMTVTEDTICQGDSTQLKVSISGGNGGPYFYELLGTGAVSANHEVNPDRTTRFIMVGSDGCGSPQVSDELYVTVLEAPIPNISASPVKGCAPLTVSFTEHNANNANVNYQWDFNDGSYFNGSNEYNPSYEFKNSGLYSVRVRLSNDFGCSTTVTLPEYIEVWPTPYSDFAANTQSTTILNPTIEFYNYSIGANTNYWIFGDGDSILTANPMPHTFPALPGEYMVLLITENTYGCKDTAYMKIEVLEDNLFYAPNAFNPHSFINENRTFKPYIMGLDESNYQLLIYNRWGEVIFETKDPNKGWDGRNSNGELYPPATFPWFIQYSDKAGTPFLKKGNLSIIY